MRYLEQRLAMDGKSRQGLVFASGRVNTTILWLRFCYGSWSG